MTIDYGPQPKWFVYERGEVPEHNRERFSLGNRFPKRGEKQHTGRYLIDEAKRRCRVLNDYEAKVKWKDYLG